MPFALFQNSFFLHGLKWEHISEGKRKIDSKHPTSSFALFVLWSFLVSGLVFIFGWVERSGLFFLDGVAATCLHVFIKETSLVHWKLFII